MKMSKGPKLILVENFDELKVGMAVWIRPQLCCGLNSGRTILIDFETNIKAVMATGKIFYTDGFTFVPLHACKVLNYPNSSVGVRSSLITPQAVMKGIVYVEVIDLDKDIDKTIDLPHKNKKLVNTLLR
jgi:hypothetical protein